MKRIAHTFALMASLSALASTAARADGPYLAEHHWGREGIIVGGDLGFGHISCSGDGCDSFTEAGSFGLHIGGMITPRIAVMADAWWMLHTEDRLTVSQGIFTGAVRFWAIPRLWLQLGLGAARVDYTYSGTFSSINDHTEWVPAFQIGVGVEIIATHHFALDVALRYGTGFYSDGDYRIHNVALVLGASFF